MVCVNELKQYNTFYSNKKEGKGFAWPQLNEVDKERLLRNILQVQSHTRPQTRFMKISDRFTQMLSCEDNKEHYDGNARPHSHFYCRCCHKVSDLNTPMPVFHHLADEIGFQGTIDACVTFYMGVCPLCNAAK